jgi:hypothetical protein
MSYGTIKVDTITFTDNSVDKSVSLSGLIQNPTFTGNITVTGTISGDVIRGGTTVSGATVTGTTANFVSGVFTTQISGATVTGTTASFTSGVFTNISGTTATITSGIIASGTAAAPSLAILADLDTGLFSPGANQLAVATNGTGITIDSSGRLLAGTATSDSNFNSGVQIAGIGGSNASSQSISRFSADATSSSLWFQKSRGASVGTNTIVNNGDDLGLIGFYGANGSTVNEAARITAQVDGTPGASNDMPGRLVFSTTADGGSSPTERLRITSAGRVGIGTSSPGTTLSVGSSATGGYNGGVYLNRGASTYNFYEASDGTNTVVFGLDNTISNVKIGTVNSYPVGFYTGNSERLHITSAGLVGIGTNAPAQKLEIQDGSISIGSSSNANATNVLVAGYGYILSGTKYGNTSIRSTYSNSNNAASLEFYVASVSTSTAEAMRIDSSGRVGIGTSSPQKTFHVLNPGSTYQADLRLGGTSTYYFDLSHDPTTTGKTIYNAYALSGTSHGHQFQIAGTNALLIDSSGRVGIGTTSPAETLHISAAAPYIRVEATGGVTGSAYYGFNNATGGADIVSSSHIRFAVPGLEAARIDSSGRLLVGTSTARSSGGHTGSFQLEGTTFATATAAITANSSDGNGAYLNFGKARGGSIGSTTIVQSGDVLGQIQFNGSDGTSLQNAAFITASVDGTPGANDMPGRLVFSTTADGASSPTERMRITNSGQVLISCTSFPSATVKGVGWANNSGVGFFYASAVSLTSSVEHAEFINPNGVVGSISTNASATAYNTSSDYRLKENIEPVTDGITRLQKLKPSRFNFIADPDTTFDGFIAHEAQAVVPECVTGEKDAVDDDGNPKHQGIDQSKLVPLLTAALQEAIGEIESLKARLTAAGI